MFGSFYDQDVEEEKGDVENTSQPSTINSKETGCSPLDGLQTIVISPLKQLSK